MDHGVWPTSNLLQKINPNHNITYSHAILRSPRMPYHLAHGPQPGREMNSLRNLLLRGATVREHIFCNSSGLQFSLFSTSLSIRGRRRRGGKMQSCLRRSSQQRFLGTSSPFFPSVKPVVPFLSGSFSFLRFRFNKSRVFMSLLAPMWLFYAFGLVMDSWVADWVIFLPVIVVEYDARQTRFASTVPVRGAGHVIRKGTGGRSSVRWESLFSY